MKTMTFEWKKLWKQKKTLLIFAIVIAYGIVSYMQNMSDQDDFKDDLYSQTESIRIELGAAIEKYAEEERKGEIDEVRQFQQTYAEEAMSAMYAWRSAIDREQWQDVPAAEKNFLTILQAFSEAGGVINELNGHELDKAIQKNDWLNEYGLPVENERVPVSPHSFTKEFADTVLSLAGLILFVLLLGSSVTGEKEQHTWSLIRTQPVSRGKVIVSKYLMVTLALLCTTIVTISTGILIALALGDASLTLNYPVLLSNGTDIKVITTATYLLRLSILFLSAGLVAFSINMIFNSLLNQSFIAVACTLVVLGTGILLAQSSQVFETFINPFSVFLMSDLLERVPGNTDMLYPLSAMLWSALFIWIAVKIPDQQGKLSAAEKEKKPFRKAETYKGMNRITAFMIFEWRKLVRKGLYRQGMLLLIALVLGGYWFVSMESQEREEAYIAELQEWRESQFLVLEEWSAFIERFEKELTEQEDEMIKSSIQDNIKNTQESMGVTRRIIREIDRALESYERRDWQAFNQFHLWQIRYDNGEYNTETYVNNMFNYHGQFTMDASLEQKKLLVERDLQPLFPGSYILTIFQNWGDDDEAQQKFQEGNGKVDNSGLYTLYLLFTSYSFGIVFLVLLFVLGVGMTAEKGKKNTIRFLRTQPVSGYHLLTGKLAVASLTAIVSSISLFGVIVLLGTIVNRLGDWHYPILFYDHPSIANAAGYTGTVSRGNGFHFITLGDYLLSGLALYMLLLLFTFALAMLLSLFLKRTVSVLTVTAVLIAGGYMLGVEFFPAWSWISPFTYFNLPLVANGQLAVTIDAAGLSVERGYVILLISIVVLLSVGYIASFMTLKKSKEA